MAILVIGSREVVAAFGLVGLPGRCAAGAGELRQALDAARDDPRLRILAVEESLAELAREEIDALKLDPLAPLVVEIAGVAGPMEERHTPLDLVRRALGVPL